MLFIYSYHKEINEVGILWITSCGCHQQDMDVVDNRFDSYIVRVLWAFVSSSTNNENIFLFPSRINDWHCKVFPVFQIDSDIFDLGLGS